MRMLCLSILVLGAIVLRCNSGNTFRPSSYHDGMPFSISESSVDTEGLTLLGWRLSGYGETSISPWVQRMIYPKIDTSSILSANTECVVEVLGTVRKNVESPHNATMHLISDGTVPVPPIECRYVTVAVGWERFHEVGNPHRPGFFFCPVVTTTFGASKDACRSLHDDSVNISISIESGKARRNLNSWMKTNAPKSRPILSKTPSLGVCTNAVREGHESGNLLRTFASYYSALGFDRIVIHDTKGMHVNLFNNSIPKNVTYINFTAWDVLGLSIKHSNEKGNNKMIKQGDQNKALTFTYCRFEMSHFIDDILIVDFDEFLFCPEFKREFATQANEIRNIVKISKRNKQHSLLFQRAALPYSASRNCTLDRPGMYFGCYDQVLHQCPMTQARNSKAMHHGLVCPGTDNHASCNSHIWKNRGCDCNTGHQNKCKLLHLNTAKCGKQISKDKHDGQTYPKLLEAFANHPSAVDAVNNHGIVNELALMMIVESDKLVEVDRRIDHSISSVKLHMPTTNFTMTSGVTDDTPQKHSNTTIENNHVTPLFVNKPFQGYNSSRINIFFILTPDRPFVKGFKKRFENVQNMQKHDKDIKWFLGLYWDTWDIIKRMFKTFRLPNGHMPELRGTRNRRGKYARWASLVLATSYMIQFRLPHMVILEDDTTWPKDLGTQVSKLLRENDDKMVKLSKWGEGYLLSLGAAVSFIRKIYEVGINKHSDTWIRDTMNPVVENGKIHYRLIVNPNDGNIYNSARVKNEVDFDYRHSLNESKPLFDRIGIRIDPDDHTIIYMNDTELEHLLFRSRDDLNFTEVADRLDGSLPGYSC